MKRFFHYQLRTLHVDAAQDFYAAVLPDGPATSIFPLHEQALARGARPHWLGYIEVDKVDPALEAFTARGATLLGTKWVSGDGFEAAVIRDPGGAVVALGKPPPSPSHFDEGDESPPSGADVVFHLLHTADLARAKANYAELFGWEFRDPISAGTHGVLHPFAWHAAGEIVGALRSIEMHPGVHSHWLFHIRVAALEPAIEAVRTLGGRVLGPFVLPNGNAIAVCDDPQGAAFALLEARAGTKSLL